MRRVFMLVMVFAIMLSFTSRLSAAPPSEDSPKKKDNWLIYWYICGSSLESGTEKNIPGQATKDMEELANFTFAAIEENSGNTPILTDQAADNTSGRTRDIVPKENKKSITEELDKAVAESKLKKFPAYIDPEISKDFPPNVKVLIQTGGAAKWFTADIPNNTIGRYIYDSNGMHYQGAFADTDMGSVETLANFLQYGKETIEKDFKPDHRMFIFWNHGGLAGVCYDERYVHPEDSFLDLNEINEAFARVYKPSPNNPPFEIIGFDACIRATYENANSIYGFAKYMVASEENESDYGWYYTDWIRQLGERPSISGKNLGQIICQSSFDYLKEKNDPNAPVAEATFSVIELSPEKWLLVRNAYDNFSKNILSYTNKNPYMYGALDKIAFSADRYSQTQHSSGLTLDLKSFAENTQYILQNGFEYEFSKATQKRLNKDAAALISAIDTAVVFNVSGENRLKSNGLAIHYPLNKNAEELSLYAAQKSAPKSMKELYLNMMPNLPEDFSLNKSDEPAASSRSTNTRGRDSRSRNLDEVFNLSDLTNLTINVDDVEDNVSVQLNKEQLKKLSDIRCLLTLSLEEDMEEGTPAAKLIEAMGLEDGGALFLGESTNLKREWNNETYTVTDNFDASWPMLNQHLIFMTVLETDTIDADGNIKKYGYTTYGIPLLINDEEGYMLKVVYHHADKKYQIVGARKEVKGVGRATRGFTQLKAGDKVTPIFLLAMHATENDIPGKNGVIAKVDTGENSMVFKYIRNDSLSFILEEEPIITNEPLQDGEYGYWFEFVNPRKKPTFSSPALFEIYKGEVLFTEEIEDTSPSSQDITVETKDKKYTVDVKTHEIKEETPNQA